MKAYFWAFVAADGHGMRISNNKYADPLQACRDCYGCVLPTMWAKALTTRVADLRTAKFRQTHLVQPTDENPSGWVKWDHKLRTWPVPQS